MNPRASHSCCPATTMNAGAVGCMAIPLLLDRAISMQHSIPTVLRRSLLAGVGLPSLKRPLTLPTVPAHVRA